jgi:hypothetical protein
MPPLKRPSDLKTACVDNLIQNMDKYWLNDFSYLKSTLDDAKKKFLYFIGPFVALSDQNVDYMLRSMYQRNMLNKFSLLLCAHNYLKCLDLSFVKKKFILTDEVCHFIGNNCFVSEFFFLLVYVKFGSSQIS